MSTAELTSTTQPEKKRFNYGALIIAVTVVINFASMAFFYSYGVFIRPLAEELGGSRTQASIPSIIFLFAVSVSAPFVGILLDKYPIRRIMLIFTISMSCGLMLLSLVQTQWQFYCVVGLIIGLSVQGMGTLATTKLLTNWFIKHRGFALGLSAIGLSTSGMLMPILSAWLIGMVGWKTSYLIFGIANLVLILPITAYFIFNRPEDIKLRCDFNAASAENIDTAAEAHITMSSRQILQNSTFWKIIFVVGIPAGVLVAMITHTVPYVTDFGISNMDAAAILSMIAVVAMFGKAGWGWLADRFESRFAIFLSLIIQAAGVGLFLYGDSYWELYIAACIYGLGMGSIPPFQGVLVAKAFGRASFGKVFGYTVPAMLPFTLGLIYLGAAIYDNFNNYNIAFYTFISLYVVAALVASQLRLPKQYT